MAINAQLQPISRILDPGITIPEGQNPIGNFMAAYMSQAKAQDERAAMPKEERPRRFRTFARGFLGAGDELNPNARAQREAAEEETLSRRQARLQTDEIQKTIPQLMGEFSGKSVEEMYSSLAKLAPLTATPAGQRLFQTFERIADNKRLIEENSLAKQAQYANAKQVGSLAAKYGIDPNNPEELAFARKSEAVDGMIEQARMLGRELTAADIPDDLFDANGRADPRRRLEVINSAGVTEALDLQRDILDQRAVKPVLDPNSAQPILMDGKPTGKAMMNTGAVIDLPQDRAKSLTEAQANALNYSERMNFNNGIIEGLMASGFDPTTLKAAAQDKGPNFVASSEFQQYDAARKNWVAAVLRKESGAAISASEYKTAFEQYFPRFGDSAEVVAQKAELRKLAEANMRKAVGDISADRAPAGTAVQVQETVSIPSFNDEESARAAGLKSGDIFWFYDPNTATKRKARLK